MNIELIDLDKKYYNTLEDKKVLTLNDPLGHFYTITQDDKKVGIIGVIISKNNLSNFIQIVIEPKYRGQGILQIAQDLVVKKHSLKKLYVTLLKDNKAAIKSFQKAGFTTLEKERLDLLRSKGYLKPTEIRLEKDY